MAAKTKRKPYKLVPFDPKTTGSPPDCYCVSNGSINACLIPDPGHFYNVTAYTSDPAHGGTRLGGPFPCPTPSGGSFCNAIPAGDGPYPASRLFVWSCSTNGSNYSQTVNIDNCGPTRTGSCAHCHEPPPAAMSVRLDPPVEAGSCSASEQVNRLTSLFSAQDPNYPCCWFSQPVDANNAGENAAHWMLKKTADDTWFLCLRRISHEVAAYHFKGRNSNRFPIKLKRGRVSKDFKKWPGFITIDAAE